MKLFNILLIPCNSASEFYFKFKKKMLYTVLEVGKVVFIVAITLFFLLEYVLPFTSTNLRIDLPDRVREFFSYKKSVCDASVQEVLNLANMIRLITNDQLSEGKVLRYAGLIFQASLKYSVNPLEIIAIIMAAVTGGMIYFFRRRHWI